MICPRQMPPLGDFLKSDPLDALCDRGGRAVTAIRLALQAPP